MWKEIDQNLKKELYNTRNQNAKIRQYDIKSQIEALEDAVKNSGIYTVSFEGFNEKFHDILCARCNDFKIGTLYHEADTVNGDFFYRLVNLERFFNDNKNNLHESKFNAKTSTLLYFQNYEEVELNFAKIYDKYYEEKKWLNLNILMNSFFTYKGFSWWTNDFVFEDYMLSNEYKGIGITEKNKWILDFAFSIGYSSDWLNDYLLFLRIDKNKIDLSNIRVPSAVNAFCEPIFSPQIASKNKWGKAYDLADSVVPKTREYLITNIEVENVEFIPVKIINSEIDDINSQSRLNDELIKKLIANI